MKMFETVLFGSIIFYFLFAPCMGVEIHNAAKEGNQITSLKFTILYDNYLHEQGTKPDWGFSSSCSILEPNRISCSTMQIIWASI
jgi:hypothetical protein